MSTAQNKRHQKPSVWEEASAAPREWVGEHPLPSTFVAFGIGLGIGVLLGQSLSSSVGRRFQPEASTMEKFGRQAFEVLRSSLPETLSRHLPS
jgi:hypothetical protein